MCARIAIKVASRFRNSLPVLVVISSLLLASCAETKKESRGTSRNANVSISALNINEASAAELESLPEIGESLAKRIVEYRARNGRFRRPEHLLLVPGISEKRFRQLRGSVRTE